MVSLQCVKIHFLPWYVKAICSTGLSGLFHTPTSAKPIALHTITQRSKTDYPTTTHDRPFQVMCLKNITRPPPRRGQGSDYSSRKVFHHSACMCHNQVVSFLKLGNVWSRLILATPAFLLDHSHTPPRQYQHRALQSSGGRSEARSRCAEDGVPFRAS